MMASGELAQRRKVRAIARRYERDGYRVTMPVPGEALPGFPEGFAPDLIAESDTDRVVVQIKQSRAVRGANDIEALAEHVAGRPGWRFELVTIKAREDPPWPVAGRFALIADRARQAIGLGLDDVGYVYAVQGLEMLLKETALRNGIGTVHPQAFQAALHLEFLGLLGPDDIDAIRTATTVRDRLLAEANPPDVPIAGVDVVLTLGERLQRDSYAKVAA